MLKADGCNVFHEYKFSTYNSHGVHVGWVEIAFKDRELKSCAFSEEHNNRPIKETLKIHGETYDKIVEIEEELNQ